MKKDDKPKLKIDIVSKESTPEERHKVMDFLMKKCKEDKENEH